MKTGFIFIDIMIILIASILLIAAIKFFPILIDNFLKLIKKILKIMKLKKAGFSRKKRLIFSDGKMLFYGSNYDIEKIHSYYYGIIMTDNNLNILNSEILGLGNDVEYNDGLIRVINHQLLIGFINKKTGLIEIDCQFDKAKPFCRYCNVHDEYEKMYSAISFPENDHINYIDTTGKLIIDKNFFGCPQK